MERLRLAQPCWKTDKLLNSPRYDRSPHGMKGLLANGFINGLGSILPASRSARHLHLGPLPRGGFLWLGTWSVLLVVVNSALLTSKKQLGLAIRTFCVLPCTFIHGSPGPLDSRGRAPFDPRREEACWLFIPRRF